jgi:predicted ATPase
VETAESLVADDALTADDILTGILALVDKSLVVAELTDAGTMRYRLLETLRANAPERLNARGEADQVRSRHAAYFLGLAEELEPKFAGPDEGPSNRPCPGC